MNTFAPLIRVAQQGTDQQLETHYKVQAAIGYILNNYDDLKGTELYNQKIENLAKRFFKALDEREKEICTANPKSADRAAAMQQLQDSYEVFENMLDCIFSIPLDRHHQFAFQFEEFKKRFTNR